jgi:hypothetical protein
LKKPVVAAIHGATPQPSDRPAWPSMDRRSPRRRGNAAQGSPCLTLPMRVASGGVASCGGVDASAAHPNHKRPRRKSFQTTESSRWQKNVHRGAAIVIATPKPTEIVVTGVDRQKVGQVAAEIRAYRPPEPYKGKGVKYAGENIIRKEAKKA